MMKANNGNTSGDTLVRTVNAGAWFGRIVRRDGAEVELADARRIWYWAGAASLSELAIRGVNLPEECKFPDPVESITLLGVSELIPLTPAASANLRAVKPWRAPVPKPKPKNKTTAPDAIDDSGK